MASPAQLMQVVSLATGSPLATIVDVDRRLVKAGMRTKGGRGFNAAQMTPYDAGRLLTAILGSPLASKSVETVRRYMKAIVDPARSTSLSFAKLKIDELTSLPDRHSFVEALVALIGSATSGSLAIAAAENNSSPLKIEIFAFTRATYGRIRLSNARGDISASVEYLPNAPRRKSSARGEVGDLEQSRRITERTIFGVSRLLQREN